MFEEGLITLLKIVSTIVIPIASIPVLFLLSPGGDTSEPEDIFDTN
jgi:hypothetical protein